MPLEGMVDALRRASRLLDTGGSIIDIRPTAERATLDVDVGGRLHQLAQRPDSGDPTGPVQRHTAAAAALMTCVDAGLLRVDASTLFWFDTYADTAPELREHLGRKWKQAAFDDETMERARERLGRNPTAQLRVRERIGVWKARATPQTRRNPGAAPESIRA